MHIPDGFMNAGTSLGAGVVSAGGLGVAVRRAGVALQDRQAPLAGLVAAFVFAAQMLNFPVAAGTSGHLIGGLLAAVLLGPSAGAVCVAVVLLVQAFFADGGLTALGLNILNMALVTAFGGYVVFAGLRRLLPDDHRGVTVATGIAAAFSVVFSSVAFTFEYAIGGAVDIPLSALIGAMVGVHLVIGVGEGIISALTVGLVLRVRPDLVFGARDLLPSLELRGPLLVQAGDR